jgi:lipopolysaccharide transport system ATP-binding protein
MSDLAIRVENLSKQYKIRGVKTRHDTLRDHLMAGLKGLLRLNGHRSSGIGRSDTIWALKDVSLEVKRGEAVGIIGRNGAGKSTLLKILSQITEPTRGRARVYGRIGSLLEVGTGFHPELSGRENIYLNGAILGMKKAEIERRFDEIVAFAEIERFIDTPVKHYSSGMYVRLAFAVAAHLEPDILLLDEVLSVGDLAFQRKCMEHATRLRDRNATVVFVSHNMFAIKAMCNRVMYLSDGQLCSEGPPEDVIQLYEKDSRLGTAPWAQRLVGSDPSQRAIYLTDIEVLDEKGKPRSVFSYGERMRLRMSFEAPQRIENVTVGVSFMRSDNVACCNYNTVLDGLAIPFLSGKHVIELLTPPIKLVSELYSIHVLVSDKSFQRLYSAQVGATFHVRDPLLSTHFGVFHEQGEWYWQPAQRDLP